MRHDVSVDTDLDIKDGQLSEKIIFFIFFWKASFYWILFEITLFQSHSI